jgi:hypothetical protein
MGRVRFRCCQHGSDTYAGDGSGAILGYTVSNIAYT